jgi:hypothetical protein
MSGVEVAQPAVGGGEVAVGTGLYGTVGRPVRRGYRGPPDGGPVVPEPPAVQEGPEGPRELPDVGVEPGGGCVVDGGEQHVVLGDEPLHGLTVVGRAFRCDAGPGRGERDRVAGRLQ